MYFKRYILGIMKELSVSGSSLGHLMALSLTQNIYKDIDSEE